MSENGNELWKIYERFGVAIGLIVDLAAIIAFILQPRLVGGNVDYEVDTGTVYGLLIIALVYSLGFVNYQVYKRWRTRNGEIIDMAISFERRFALSGLMTFPVLILYFLSYHTATDVPGTFAAAPGVFTNAFFSSIFSGAFLIPLVAVVGSLFELVILGNSKWDVGYSGDYQESDYHEDEDQTTPPPSDS